MFKCNTWGETCITLFLITVKTIDEYGEGLHVAWMISCQKDASALTMFLRAMMDVAILYLIGLCSQMQNNNAWQSVFGLEMYGMSIQHREKLQRN